MATVVDRLSSAPVMSSTPALIWVMAASVVRGSISEMAPTIVVLPTAKPPATIIFTGRGTVRVVSDPGGACSVVMSELPKAIEHPFQQFDVGSVVPTGSGPAGCHQPLGLEVPHDHHGHAEGELEMSGDLGHGLGVGTEVDHPSAFEDEAGQGPLARSGRLDDRLIGQVDRAGVRPPVMAYGRTRAASPRSQP